jgi:hypothetical protein
MTSLAQTNANELIQRCKEILPVGVQEKIAWCVLSIAYPRPDMRMFPELRTAKPTIHYPPSYHYDTTHTYPVKIKGGFYEIQAGFYKNKGLDGYKLGGLEMRNLSRTEPICRKYPIRCYPSGSLSISPYIENTETDVIREWLIALYVVGSKYGFNIMRCRLYWDHATRKQKSVRRLFHDLQK